MLIKGAKAIGVRIGGLNKFQLVIYSGVMREIIRLQSEGKLRPYISHQFPLEHAAEAIQAIIDRKVIGEAVLVG